MKRVNDWVSKLQGRRFDRSTALSRLGDRGRRNGKSQNWPTPTVSSLLKEAPGRLSNGACRFR